MLTKKTHQHSKDFTVTRTGVSHQPEVRFGYEERFLWQKPRYDSDVSYDIAPEEPLRSVVFGTSSRSADTLIDPETKKRNNGPGSYDIAHGFEFNSEYISRKGNRFAVAPRQSGIMKTPSPGAIYNIERKYYMGPDKFSGYSFPKDVRKPLATVPTSADAEMLNPRLPKAVCITMAKRLPAPKKNIDVPGAIYDVHKYVNFKTGPAFSFSKGRSSRFSDKPFLPEID